MTRKEGIIKQWTQTHKDKPPLTDKEQINLFTAEYGNYLDCCHYCHEKPLFRYQWLHQEIRPLT